MATRTEVNFQRLLHKCECLAKNDVNGDWRLEKYVGALSEQLTALRKQLRPPSKDVMTEFSRRVDFLKNLLEAEKLPQSTEKAIAVQLLSSGPTVLASSAGVENTVVKEVYMKTKAKVHKEMKDELLGAQSSPVNGTVRQRTKQSDASSDVDTVVKHHKQMQERLADEMMSLARNLKENARTAGNIVKEDIKAVDESNRLAGSNVTALGVEATRLEGHVARAWNCWIWVLLVMVLCTFIWMVLFMRLFPKR